MMPEPERIDEPAADADLSVLAEPPTDTSASMPAGEKRSPPPLTRIALYIIACLLGGLVGLVPAIAIGVIWLLARGGQPVGAALQREAGIFMISSVFGIYPALVLVTCLFVWYVDRRTLAQIGLTRRRWARQIGAGIAIGAGFVAIQTLLYVALGWVRLSPGSMPLDIRVTLPLMCLVIGVTEELVFRGYLMQTLDEWRGRRVAILVSSVLFWLVHVGQGNVHQPLGAAAMLATAVLLALCRYGAGSLWLPIGLHAAYDWGALSLGGAAEQGIPPLYRLQITAPPWLVGPPGYSGAADLVCLVLLLAGVYRFLYQPNQRKAGADLALGQI